MPFGVLRYFAPRLGVWSGGRGNGKPVIDDDTMPKLALSAAECQNTPPDAPQAAVARNPVKVLTSCVCVCMCVCVNMDVSHPCMFCMLNGV